MTTELIWVTIAVNAVIAIVTIANSWALAWYSKKSRKRPRTTQAEKPRRTGKLIGLLCAVALVLSVGGLLLAILFPHPIQNLYTLQVAFSVGEAVFYGLMLIVWKVMLSARERDNMILDVIDMVGDVTDLVGDLTKKVKVVADSLPPKSPNPTVDTDARKNGARGSQ
jgi:uncharacterized membrane protein YbjE (DUF340 family)